MQNSEIVKHEPMLQVTMKDGRILFLSKSREQEFETALRAEHFVKIEGVRINKFEIKYIEDMPKEYDLLLSLTEDQRAQALAEFRKYKENLGVEPPRKVKLRKIARIVSGTSD